MSEIGGEIPAMMLVTDHEQAVSAAVTERDARIKELEAALRHVAWTIEESAAHKASGLTAAENAAFGRDLALLRSLLSVDPNTEKEARS